MEVGSWSLYVRVWYNPIDRYMAVQFFELNAFPFDTSNRSAVVADFWCFMTPYLVGFLIWFAVGCYLDVVPPGCCDDGKPLLDFILGLFVFIHTSCGIFDGAIMLVVKPLISWGLFWFLCYYNIHLFVGGWLHYSMGWCLFTGVDGWAKPFWYLLYGCGEIVDLVLFIVVALFYRWCLVCWFWMLLAGHAVVYFCIRLAITPFFWSRLKSNTYAHNMTKFAGGSWLVSCRSAAWLLPFKFGSCLWYIHVYAGLSMVNVLVWLDSLWLNGWFLYFLSYWSDLLALFVDIIRRNGRFCLWWYLLLQTDCMVKIDWMFIRGLFMEVIMDRHTGLIVLLLL